MALQGWEPGPSTEIVRGATLSINDTAHEVSYLSPHGSAPSKIIGIGQNYRAHAAEMGKGIPEEPLMFLKPPLRDHRRRRADRASRRLRAGRLRGRARRRDRQARASVSREQALDYVEGYTFVNDVTVRDLQKKDGQWTRAKGFDTFCPIGPRIVPGSIRRTCGSPRA